MKEKILSRFVLAAVVSGGMILGLDAPVSAQEAPQIPRETPQKASADTSGRFRMFLEGAYGVGFDTPEIGVTTVGDEVSLSGGGGIGVGVGMGYGISKDFDLELSFGYQESALTPSVRNAEGTFGRYCLLATVKRKMPTSDTGQFKVGVGMGTYSGGKMDADLTDAGGAQMIIKYATALGFHFTGEFERFMTKNTALSIGGKLYFVKYDANSARENGAPVPVSLLPSDQRNLDGSGLDFTVRISRYF